jgi:hypothetical protein
MHASHSSRRTRPEYVFIVAKIFAGFAFFGSLIFLLPLAVSQTPAIHPRTIQPFSHSMVCHVAAHTVGAVSGGTKLD